MGQCYSSRRRSNGDDSMTKPGFATTAGGIHIRTVMTSKQSHSTSPTSIIIPEITEHVNHSFSSDDDEEFGSPQQELMRLQHPQQPTTSWGNNRRRNFQRPETVADDERHPLAIHDDDHNNNIPSYRSSKSGRTMVPTGGADAIRPPPSTTTLTNTTRTNSSRRIKNSSPNGYLKPKRFHSGTSSTITTTTTTTSLNTVQRERIFSPTSAVSHSRRHTIQQQPQKSSHHQRKEDDIIVVDDTDDGSRTSGNNTGSPAVLRRLLAETKRKLRSTGRWQNTKQQTTTTSFSQVHESLSRSIIMEEDEDEGDIPPCRTTSATTTTTPKQLSFHHHRRNEDTMESMGAPSDEENEPATVGADCTSSRRRGDSFLKSTNLSNLEPAVLPIISRRRRTLPPNATTTSGPGATTGTTPSSKFKHHINQTLERIGPLSPVKLKTSHCVSPHSIRVYNSNDIDNNKQSRTTMNDIPAITTVMTTATTSPTAFVATTKQNVITTIPAFTDDANTLSPAAIDTRTMQNFTKLQLQIQVAARQAQKQRHWHKVEDRINDVQQHRQLWDEFQHIQNDLCTTTTTGGTTTTTSVDNNNVLTDADNNATSEHIVKCAENDMPTIPRTEQDAVEPSTTSTESQPPTVEQTSSTNSIVDRVRRLRRRKPRRLWNDHRNTTADEPLSSAVAATVPALPVEYDLEEDIPMIVKQKISSPQRRLQIGHQKSKSSPNINLNTEPNIDDAMIINHADNDTSTTHSRAEKPLVRSHSFDLRQTNTWFFDFQEKFDVVVDPNQQEINMPFSTTTTTKQSKLMINTKYNHSPMERQQHIVSSTGSTNHNSSQADLSLLSECSLEVQRRLYAEKRRQRKKTSNSCVPTTPKGPSSAVRMDNTPLARNGTNRGNNRNGGSSSHRSMSSNDYGPSSKGRQALSVTSIAGGDGGSAQEIYNAPNEAEKLRIAKEILRRRNVTNMEVTFSTPKQLSRKMIQSTITDQGENSEMDGSSFISDLDESYTSHHTNRSNQSTANNNNNDYGPQRRPSRRRQNNNNSRGARDSDMEDQSSILSDVSFDLSHKLDIHHTNLTMDGSGGVKSSSTKIQVTTANSTGYDFQLIVQRRLDIEERLRALMKNGDDTELPPSASHHNIDSNSIVVAQQAQGPFVAVDTTGPNNEYISQQKLQTTDYNIGTENRTSATGTNAFERGYNDSLRTNEHVVTPNNKTKTVAHAASKEYYTVHDVLSEISIVTPNTADSPSLQRLSDSLTTKGRSDFSRLLDAVEVTRPGGHDVTPDSANARPEFSSSTHASTLKAIASDNKGNSVAIIENDEYMEKEDVPSLSFQVSTANLATSLSVINESYESSESPHSSNTMKLPMRCNVHDRTTSDDRSINSHNETLLLADQVEANVNDMLKRYRHRDDSSTLVTTPLYRSSSSVQEFPQTMSMLNVIEDSPS